MLCGQPRYLVLSYGRGALRSSSVSQCRPVVGREHAAGSGSPDYSGSEMARNREERRHPVEMRSPTSRPRPHGARYCASPVATRVAIGLLVLVSAGGCGDEVKAVEEHIAPDTQDAPAPLPRDPCGDFQDSGACCEAEPVEDGCVWVEDEAGAGHCFGFGRNCMSDFDPYRCPDGYSCLGDPGEDRYGECPGPAYDPFSGLGECVEQR